ncbi:MAG TPA: dienelactone hydrolase family protein [Planctomycetota bacterium]
MLEAGQTGANEDLLPCVEIETAAPVRASVVWLHGLGADGHDFEPIVPHLGMRPQDGVRFVFPHAPQIPVSLNMGMRMPAWYDIDEADLRRRHDAAGIRASALRIEALLAREKRRGVPAERIVLAGFSQGGAMALYVGLRHAETLAGLVALSCYLVLNETLPAEASAANAAVPVFQAHGTLDPMVPIDRGRDARDRLQELGHPVAWHEFPMQHMVCMEEIEALGAFLRDRLGG